MVLKIYLWSSQSEDGQAFTVSSSDFTAYGVLTLTSDDGSVIVIEDGETDAHTGTDKLGLMTQSEDASTTVSGLAVGTVLQANTALNSLDSAIEKVSSFRASFGAYENRLDASINNLTTLQVNTDAVDQELKMLILLKKQQIWQSSDIVSGSSFNVSQANASKQNF